MSIIRRERPYPDKFRTPTLEELYVGMPVQHRYIGEYDMEVCTPSWEVLEHYYLNDEYTDWYWKDELLTEEWLNRFKEFTGDLRNGPGFPILGTIRIKDNGTI